MFRVRTSSKSTVAGGAERTGSKASASYRARVQRSSSKLSAEEPSGVFSSARRLVESLARDDRMAILSDLQQAYTGEKFQAGFADVLEASDACSLAYTEQMRDLLREAHEGMQSARGMPRGEEGEIVLAYLLSLHYTNNDPEGKKLVERIDNELFWEPPANSPTDRVAKRELMEIMRSLIVGYSAQDFQDKLRSLMQERQGAGEQEVDGPAQSTSDLPVDVNLLALTKQRPILERHKLEPNERGMQRVLESVAQYIMDPSVAICVSIANALLGMDEAANAKYIDRLRKVHLESSLVRDGPISEASTAPSLGEAPA